MTEFRLDRRTFLRGVGTAMALPVMEAMLPTTALAQSAKGTRINRMAFLFVPNGIDMQAWTPKIEGPLELPYTLQPLKGVKDQLNVLTGLTQHNAEALGDGGGDHARSAATWLTGCHPVKTDGANIKAGISADQLAARHVGAHTMFPSLELGVERSGMNGNCDSGYSCAYTSNIAWRGEASPVAKEINPRLVFERLFASSDPNESAESRERRRRYKLSVLDLITEDAKSLQNKLGSRDKMKLDEYFTGIREVENRLAKAEKVTAMMRTDGKQTLPTGTPGDYREHIRLMFDMMALAFQSDMTRVATFMYSNDGSNRSYSTIGVPEGHHDMSHHGGDKEKQRKVREINKFHVEQLAYLLEKLNSIHEPDGTVLDNSMIVYGAGISDGDRHNHDNLPILMAGRGAGRIKAGRHIRYENGTPMTNLFLTMLDKMGVPADSIGDSTGKLQQLL